MPIPISCPKCETRMRAPDAAAGNTVRCPKCQTRIVVPDHQPAREEEEDDSGDVAEQPRRKKSPRRKQTAAPSHKPVVIGVAVALALAGIGFGVYQLGFRKKEPVAKPPTTEEAKSPATGKWVPLDSGVRGPESAAGPPVESPRWVSDPALDNRLDPYQNVAGIRIRPPKGYALMKSEEKPGGAEMFAWVGTRREDGTAPMIAVAVLLPPPEDRTMLLTEFLNGMLDGVARQKLNSKVAVAEFGKVDGVPFARARWEGTDRATMVRLRGFSYAARYDDGTYVHVMSQDVDPGHEAELSLAEAAALTLRRK